MEEENNKLPDENTNEQLNEVRKVVKDRQQGFNQETEILKKNQTEMLWLDI